ncbi:MAG: hypothetical protein D3910_06930, partial [Candidatus Electrothrix sp. ATG2]|nr:hypothetical protein [Candidatus Electrothrix sp. ATG2]
MRKYFFAFLLLRLRRGQGASERRVMQEYLYQHLYHHVSSIDSTITLAVKMAEQGAEHGTVIHADRQTGGKGRGGRRFNSPVGGLYFSLILRPDLDVIDPTPRT